MSYKAELQANNVDLQSILDTVNALPEAGGSGGGEVVIDILPSLDLEPAYQLNAVNAYGVEMMVDYSLTVGETYRVVWDTETYICVAQDVSGFIPGAVAVGNCAGLGLSGNNEPFIIGVANGGAMYISITDTVAGNEHSVRIYQKVEDVPDGTYLQTEDGGLILAGDVGGGSMEGVHTVTFMDHSGMVWLGERLVVDGDDCADPVKRDLMDAPTKESTVEYNYSHVGWATTPNGAWDENALKAVTEDKTVYAAFAAVTRLYTITYCDTDGTVLHAESLAYGAMPTYTASKDGAFFGGWTPELAAVTGDASYTAVWSEKLSFATATWADIAKVAADGTASQHFKIGDTRTMTVKAINNNGTYLDVTFAIIAFNHDNLADGSGKAGITIMSMGHVGGSKQAYSTTYGNTGWSGSLVRSGLRDYVLPSFDEELQAVIKSVNKEHVASGTNTVSTISDKLWMPSLTELGGTLSNSHIEGTAYPINRKSFFSVANFDGYLWTRSLTGTANQNKTAIRYYPTRDEFSTYNPGDSCYVPCGFCI